VKAFLIFKKDISRGILRKEGNLSQTYRILPIKELGVDKLPPSSTRNSFLEVIKLAIFLLKVISQRKRIMKAQDAIICRDFSINSSWGYLLDLRKSIKYGYSGKSLSSFFSMSRVQQYLVAK